jgi:phosphate acyltransferase
MKIALDAMGGDFAPEAIIDGALLASGEINQETKIVLIGREEVLQNYLKQRAFIPQNFEIVNAPEVIGMAEHPAKAFQTKKQSSISVGYQLLLTKEVDAFCSAGNTGAMLVGAMFTIKLPEVLRPVILSYVPKTDGRMGIILDVGANTDCKPEMLEQFAELGSIFCQEYFEMQSPKVGLLNLGEEEQKGNAQAQATYQLLKSNAHINFIGNIEGRDLFNEQADVIVCDGFVGNVVIKMAESYYIILKKKGFVDAFFDNFNYEKVGGSPVLGVDGTVIIAHGVSNAVTIKNMILNTEKMVQRQIHTKIKEALAS